MTSLPISSLPRDERPVDRLLTFGADSLSDAELVSIIIGARSLDEGRTLIADRGLAGLASTDWTAASRQGSTRTSRAIAARIAASVELSRRIGRGSPLHSAPINDAESIARPLIARYSHYLQERLGCIYLNGKNRVIREREIYIGTLNTATVSTRDILRYAIEENAVSIIVFHNHPSGDPAPSSEDISFTRQLSEASKLLSIDLIDHLILGADRFVSLRQQGTI